MFPCVHSEWVHLTPQWIGILKIVIIIHWLHRNITSQSTRGSNFPLIISQLICVRCLVWPTISTALVCGSLLLKVAENLSVAMAALLISNKKVNQHVFKKQWRIIKLNQKWTKCYSHFFHFTLFTHNIFWDNENPSWFSAFIIAKIVSSVMLTYFFFKLVSS